jgi:ketol-acid reductoisomerase
VRGAQVVSLLLPDQVQPRVYEEDVAPSLDPDAALLFAHGFNIHYGQIKPPKGVDVWMIAPKGPGHLVRRTFEEGGGTQVIDASGKSSYGDRKGRFGAYLKSIGSRPHRPHDF